MSRASITTSHQNGQTSPRKPSSPLGTGEILVRVQACGLNHLDSPPSTGAMPQVPTHGARYISAAGTVIAAGDRVTRFALGDHVFGHFRAETWASAQAACARTTADGPHVERRPDRLDALAAVALAEGALIAKTILRAAELRPGQTALVIGATSRAGTVLIPVLAQAGAYVIAGSTPGDEDYIRSLGAAETIHYTTANPVTDALSSHPDIDLFIDLLSFGEPYFITARAPHGTIVTALPGPHQPGIPRIAISAGSTAPGDLAALAQRALRDRRPAELAHVYRLENACRTPPANRNPDTQLALALGG